MEQETRRSALTLTQEEGKATVVIDVPEQRVNLLTPETMLELARVLDQLSGSRETRCLIIKSGKASGFIAGADIRQIEAIHDSADAEAKSGRGQEVLNRLDDLPFPTIAVIDGAAMGGGLELALACDYRIASDNPRTKIGLPETGLGIIPGFGGTYRLPRTVGLTRALQMILSGTPVDGQRAAKIGLVDACFPAEFLNDRIETFVARVLDGPPDRRLSRRRPPLGVRLLEGNPIGRTLLLARVRRETLKRTGGHYPAQIEALKVVRRSIRSSRERALRLERQAFGRLAPGEVSKNLVGIFFSREAAKRLREESNASRPPAPVRRSAVLGAGVMGGKIAWLFTKFDVPVVMKDIAWTAIQKGYLAAHEVYRELEKRRRYDKREVNLKMHHLSGTLEYSGLMKPDVVVEAVVEKLAVKKQVLAEVEAAVSDDALIVTNTSSLSVNDMAESLRRPERFAGMHFFNPPNRMPLVEVVPGSKTSEETVRRAVSLALLLGKTPVVVQDCPGFLVNRLLLPYLNEAALMAGEGVDYQRIDRLIEGYGMPMGPFTLFDEIGIDVAIEVSQVLEGAYSDHMKAAPLFAGFREHDDLLGKKSSKGFYLYEKDKKRRPNPEVLALLKAGDGKPAPRNVPDEDVIHRPVLALLNEAARALDDGVVGSARELDLALVFGIGFPPFRGGILRYADHLGLANVKSTLERYAASYGERFRPAPLIERLAVGGERFSDLAAVDGEAPKRKTTRK